MIPDIYVIILGKAYLAKTTGAANCLGSVV